MDSYDPDHAPTPSEWLALDEFERHGLIAAFHEDAGGCGDSPAAHTAIHGAIETQIAMREPPEAGEALARLMKEGLSRHEAIHAVGSVLIERMALLLQSETSTGFDQDEYAQALRRLTARDWGR